MRLTPPIRGVTYLSDDERSGYPRLVSPWSWAEQGHLLSSLQGNIIGVLIMRSTLTNIMVDAKEQSPPLLCLGLPMGDLPLCEDRPRAADDPSDTLRPLRGGPPGAAVGPGGRGESPGLAYRGGSARVGTSPPFETESCSSEAPWAKDWLSSSPERSGSGGSFLFLPA